MKTLLLKTCFVFSFLIFLNFSFSQVLSGPMMGYVELRTAKVWIEVENNAPVDLIYWKTSMPSVKFTAYKTIHSKFNFTTHIYDLVGLDFDEKYEYQLFLGKKNLGEKYHGTFKTQDLWQWRKPAPDFSFLTGSCSYFNEVKYDRPNETYGSDSLIFLNMAKENSAFMLWLGDSWYTREVDFGSEWGLWYRASHDRQTVGLSPFLKSMPQLAIWDDHDFGPNNEGLSYIFSEASRETFMAYFPNPSFGRFNKGTYTKMSYSDVDIFMLDDRTWRSSDDMPDFIDGKPNPNKKMFGDEQLEWLKNALYNSWATFKIIATGSQVLNSLSPNDCLTHFPVEYNDLIHFLNSSKIRGVVFLTGDRHHSEVIKLDRDSLYPLYDITVSPLTSGVGNVNKNEISNPMRIENTLLEERNYGKFSFSGARKNRKLKLEFIDKFGATQRTWEINQRDLGY